jgi:hypothetical protein
VDEGMSYFWTFLKGFSRARTLHTRKLLLLLYSNIFTLFIWLNMR